MAGDGLRARLLPALLPALLVVLLSLVAAPHRASAAPRTAVTAAAAPAAASPEQPESVVDSATDAISAPTDRAPALLTQFTAGVRGSRAPPAASA
ncbi:hypothetical protein AB0368_27465 [Actinoplanes sp. NPDC051475]|uniref:hypothetical protein n=1 Tax=Actinoplanes sp. NPDC051475 TaxID=3157225 RepID=UPI00344EF55F